MELWMILLSWQEAVWRLLPPPVKVPNTFHLQYNFGASIPLKARGIDGRMGAQKQAHLQVVLLYLSQAHAAYVLVCVGR